MSPEAWPSDLLPGTRLTAGQGKSIGQSLGEILLTVKNRRKGVLLVHDSLQNTIGLFQQLLGWQVEYEVPFQLAGWGAERVIFDIVAQQKNKVVIVEVKDLVTTRDLGQIYGYTLALKLAGAKGKLYLGTDILNYPNLVDGVVGEGVKELMHKRRLASFWRTNTSSWFATTMINSLSKKCRSCYLQLIPWDNQNLTLPEV